MTEPLQNVGQSHPSVKKGVAAGGGKERKKVKDGVSRERKKIACVPESRGLSS